MVKYQRASRKLQEKVKLRTAGKGEYDIAKKNVSVQGTRWFTIKTTPDYTIPGPWSTAIVVGNRSDDKPFLRIDVLDHGDTLDANWLTEKLIFIEVWWGRMSASDLIVDVEKKQILYDESAHYGEMTFCKE